MTENKKINYRKDIISGKLYPRNELIRLCKINNQIVIDYKYNLGGRGAYIHLNKDNLSKTFNEKIIFKAFHTDIDKKQIEALIKELSDEK